MASEALKRAGKALYDQLGIQRELPFSDLPLSMQESYSQMAGVANRAALDPTDEAQVEAVVNLWIEDGQPESDLIGREERELMARMARLAIAALRDHITGDTP